MRQLPRCVKQFAFDIEAMRRYLNYESHSETMRVEKSVCEWSEVHQQDVNNPIARLQMHNIILPSKLSSFSSCSGICIIYILSVQSFRPFKLCVAFHLWQHHGCMAAHYVA